MFFADRGMFFLFFTHNAVPATVFDNIFARVHSSDIVLSLGGRGKMWSDGWGGETIQKKYYNNIRQAWNSFSMHIREYGAWVRHMMRCLLLCYDEFAMNHAHTHDSKHYSLHVCLSFWTCKQSVNYMYGMLWKVVRYACSKYKLFHTYTHTFHALFLCIWWTSYLIFCIWYKNSGFQ